MTAKGIPKNLLTVTVLDGIVAVVPKMVPTSIVAVGALPDAGAMLDTTVPTGIELPTEMPEIWDSVGTADIELGITLLDI